MTISAAILTKNEEKNIKRCLKSVMFCDEIVVIDDYSQDETIEKVKSIKGLKNLKIIKKELKGDFAGQRNFAMRQTKNDWVLFVDADEEVTPELREEIIKLLNGYIAKEQCFYIKRRDYWWGRELKYGETKKVRNKGIIRLVNKHSGKWMGSAHEEFKMRTEKLEVRNLNGYLNHYPHSAVKEFLQDINLYTSIRAKELYNQDAATNILQIIFYPFFKFILNYFVYLGFLDGPAGFAYAFMMSFHSFLVRVKLYQYSQIKADSDADKRRT